MFNEITANAVKRAFDKPLAVNVHLVEAQQARRVLDRLVGYKISPLLWDKVRRGLSAGRVQTVALRLIVDREREIRAFQKQEYWTIDVSLNAKKPPVSDCSPAQTRRRDAARSERGDRERRSSRISTDARILFVRSRRARRAAIRSRRSSPRPCSRNRRASCVSA